MRCTRILQAPPGFWKRSLEEFKRQANIAVHMEGLRRPTKPFPIINFTEPDSIERCKIMSDEDIGGFSRASLTHEAANVDCSEPAHVLFKGHISAELPPDRLEVQRSGYAAWRTRDRGRSLFGVLLWDVDPYAYLALRIKSDGGNYFINIQTESIVPTDLHQHRLPSVRQGEWETVTVQFASFVRTNYGMPVEPQKEMLRQKVKSVGIGLTDRVPGPFQLCIADVFATNKPRKGWEIESGIEVEDRSGGWMSEIEPRKKEGEPERILI